MVQGSLSELTRQCGDPSCACAHDPASRHGPHLYLKFNAEGKAHSVYVPAGARRGAQGARIAPGCASRSRRLKIAADNRERFLRALEREKQLARRSGPRRAGRPE